MTVRFNDFDLEPGWKRAPDRKFSGWLTARLCSTNLNDHVSPFADLVSLGLTPDCNAKLTGFDRRRQETDLPT